MKPSIGRIVHYVSYGTPGGEYQSQCRSAQVAGVGAWITHTENPQGEDLRILEQAWDAEALELVVSNPTGLFFNTCTHDEDQKLGGTWHWPERVDD